MDLILRSCWTGASTIFLSLFTSVVSASPPSEKICPRSVLTADVVAIDHPMVFNRLGAQNVNWMMYALRHDVIDIKSMRVLDYTREGERLFQKAAMKHRSRDLALRPDLRPRPLVLRVSEGGYLKVRFTNLLHVTHVPNPAFPNESYPNQANPFRYPDPLPSIDHPVERPPENLNPALTESDLQEIYRIDNQVASRMVGFHPQGLEVVRNIDDDSSYVGKNNSSMPAEEHGSLAKPGETREYCFYAHKEGAYLISNDGAVFGGEGTAGNSGVGLFGAVTVQPKGARFYRAQLTEEEMRLATAGKTVDDPTGQPVIDYEQIYPDDCLNNGIWCREGKAKLPILNMVQKKRIVHGDINAIIVGPGDDGRFLPDTYPLEKIGKRNPALPNRLEPFREFVSVFHDENAATQAFPYFFEHPELGHTLHGVRDAFMINYGSGGIGSEIIANRLKAGPMQDCLDCAFEEFFLSSFAVGDPAMLVDKPANLILSQCQPEFIQMVPDPSDREKEILDPAYAAHRAQYCTQPKFPLNDARDQRASMAYYPHDPANVHHSYIGDFVKFRNLHSGKEQHIFHLHNHQWLFNANDDNSNYIDAQALGPGSGYTYEIAYGGSGNRNKTVGDAIFHCHFYPHFAQGMWYMWRNHDVFEAGTRLRVSGDGKHGYHQSLFGLRDGTPATGARALPDGEIVAGTPIPAIVPLPGKGIALMPAEVSVVPRIGADGNVYGSMAEVSVPKKAEDINISNPGYPFWVAGVSRLKDSLTEQNTSVGSRPTTPPLDMYDPAKTFVGPNLTKLEMTPLPNNVSGHDGGLPRHSLAGYSAEGKTHEKLDRLTAEKHIERAKPIYYPEEGTALEQIAMAFHAVREHATYMSYMNQTVAAAKFVTNGAPPVPGAPYNEPCIADDIDDINNRANVLKTGGDGKFFGGADGRYIHAKNVLLNGIEFGGDLPRIYKGANLQLDVVFNKLGYHYPQQRILTLWEDVGPLLGKSRAPEPLVIRMNTFDCAMYAHTNLVPKDFYADDFQITTPTDVIGQHIHLPKWDLTSADGSANGWNYEDGTFSPGMVRERITAINRWHTYKKTGTAPLEPVAHPYFGVEFLEKEEWKVHQKDAKFCKDKWNEVHGDAKEFDKRWGMPGACNWFGARTTLQRWFSDPLVNAGGVHRGLGITFTHDHLGPSTHQQLGLYATMLTEPPGSMWRHNETGEKLYDPYVRQDGGPTSWQAVITGKESAQIDIDGDQRDDSHREFFLQFGDFQHAYEEGAYYGVNKEGVAWPLDPNLKSDPQKTAQPTKNSFRFAINPSVRKPAQPDVFPDIFQFEPVCPGGPGSEKLPGAVYNRMTPPRPCPEAIAADDVGMMVVNYRNEPIGARVYDPKGIASDSKVGAQAQGFAGDLVFAFQTRTDRAMPELNTEVGKTPYPALTAGIQRGDPFTPIMRAYSGDLVRIKIQAGSHEHEHNASINSLAWLQGGSGFGQAPHSGWRNAQNTGLSEQFTFAARITDYESREKYLNDRMYTLDSSQDGLWNGVWGVLRSLNRRDDSKDNLVQLPSNPKPTLLIPGQGAGIDNGCPRNVKVQHYYVSAVLANKALKNSLNVTIPFPSGSNLDPDGGTLIYNPRATKIRVEIADEEKGNVRAEEYKAGPLHDPTAILFVRDSDLDPYTNTLKPGRPVEPLVLRVAAGECIQVHLTNLLPYDERYPLRNPEEDYVRGLMPDLQGYTSLSGIISRDKGEGAPSSSGATSFNNNLIRPSVYIGLHPQLLHSDVHSGDGDHVGINTRSWIAPRETKVYTWYAGILEIVPTVMTGPGGEICLDPPNLGLAEQNEAYALLEAFAQPKPRPLSVLLTESVFRREFRARLFGNQSIGEILNLADTETGEERSRSFSKRVELEELEDKMVRAATNLNCLDSIYAETSAADHKLPWTYSNDDSRAAISKPSFSSTTYFDRGEILEKRNACAINSAKIVESALNLATRESHSQIYPSAKETHAVEALSQIVSGIFAFNPKEDLPAKLAGHTRLAKLSDKAGDDCRFVGVEFGGTNLTPPDRIKQGQKGAVGALIVEPHGAKWLEDAEDVVIDRQNPGVGATNERFTHTTKTVSYPVGFGFHKRSFRDLIMVHQKGLNLRYSDGSAVANLAAEKEKAGEDPIQTAPEDAHDSGHMAINYGTEPMWFRFGLPPDAPFGKEGFGGAASAWQAFSNECCDNRTASTGGTVITADTKVGEPYVPIMTVAAGKEMRIRALMPTGVGRASTVELHGHHWLRDPYPAEKTGGGLPIGFRRADWGIPSFCIGKNTLGMTLGGQESLTPMGHFDMVFPRAGGKNRIAGDYLWRDHGGFGITSGLWSIVRVERSWWHWLHWILPHGEWRDSCN